jgi:hypothetical protein
MISRLKSTFCKIRLYAAVGIFASAAIFSHAQSPVTIQLESQKPGSLISQDFVGLSFEMQYVLASTNGHHFFSAKNKSLIATFKTLGVKSLRVGGNTADRPTIPTPTTADVDSLFAFAKAADVKVIYTLRLNQGSLDAATQMANYITRHYAKHLACFAIGNEPNVFSKEYAPYLAEWKRYAAQITALKNSPAAKFCGPSTSPGHETWARDFANEFGNHGPLAFISQHDYPGGDARRATNSAAARDKILSPEIDAHYTNFSANFVLAILSNALPYRLEEANSFYDGGALDVSDTFASALWALDYQWWWASHGASGINFHTGDKVAARDENKPCSYAVFWTSPEGYNVHPIGYALKMFSLGARGSLLPVTTGNPENLNLTAYAVALGKDAISVTLINREHGPGSRSAIIQLNPGIPNANATAMFLTATNADVAAKTGVTLGRAEIQDNANWDGKWAPLTESAEGGQFIFTLPASSAALVTLTPNARAIRDLKQHFKK